MKKFLTIFCLLLALSAGAQKYYAGMMYNPQGKIVLNELKKGFSLSNPLYAVVTIEKGAFSYSPMFCFNNSSWGGFISHSFGKDKLYNTYLVGVKNLMDRDFYLGLGLGRKVSGECGLFIEFGYLTNIWQPQFYLGMSIPIMTPLKK